uniref:Uncharacterized protein n=1 Tax=viral metagenome TaxID=1070528 RepID=A0A6H1ZWG5_9ZZZZ
MTLGQRVGLAGLMVGCTLLVLVVLKDDSPWVGALTGGLVYVGLLMFLWESGGEAEEGDP